MQNDRSLDFLRKALSDSHKSLSICEKEFLALIYYGGGEVEALSQAPTICHDHKSLCYLDDQVLQYDLQTKAMTRLMGVNIKIL